MPSMLIAALLIGQTCTPPPTPSKIIAYPSGRMIENVGTSDIPITSKSDKAKAFIRQGFALIHCFWFNEAVRSFRDATKEDPTCAIAWCGLNISLTQPWFVNESFHAEADYAIQRAVQLCGESSNYEQEMIAAFRLRSFSKDERGTDFEASMTDLLKHYPDTFEGRLIWASIRCQLCMGQLYDKNGDNHFELEKVYELIKPVLAKDPTNPAALHYHIHAVEGSDPQSAVESARQLGKSAAGCGHMVHMPGHIFYNVGLWDEGRAAFEGCRKIEEAYAKELGVSPGAATWNYPHNVRFLAYHLAEMGRMKEAKERLALLGDKDGFMILERTGDWTGLSINVLKNKDKPGQADYNAYVMGKVWLQSNNISEARKQLDQLGEVFSKMPGDDQGQWARSQRFMTQSLLLDLRACVEIAEKKSDEGAKSFSQAMDSFEKIEYAEPPNSAYMTHESAGWTLLKAGMPAEAETAFRRGLKVRPNSGWLLFGVAEAIRAKSGDEAAKPAYEEFLKQWKDADPDLPYMLKARERMAAIARIEGRR